MSQRFDSALISGAHLYGGAGLGVLGSLIPATGDNGAGYTYNDLSLPADNAKEICGRITTWPISGTLTAYEDTSFEFTAPDGAHSFAYQLYVDGVATGSPATVSLYVGSVPVEIPANLGTVAASGFSATIASTLTIPTSVGTAMASGFSSGVSSAATIVTNLGTSTASGYQANLTSTTTIDVNLGAATASGFTSEVSTGAGVTITCSAGSSNAAGYSALIEFGFTLTATIGTASATGYRSAIVAGGVAGSLTVMVNGHYSNVTKVMVRDGTYRDVTVFAKSNGQYSLVAL